MVGLQDGSSQVAKGAPGADGCQVRALASSLAVDHVAGDAATLPPEKNGARGRVPRGAGFVSLQRLDERHNLPELLAVEEEQRHRGARDPGRNRIGQGGVAVSVAQVSPGNVRTSAARSVSAVAFDAMGAIDAPTGGNVFRSGVGIGVCSPLGAAEGNPGQEDGCDQE